ncbi:MAG: hypothetical protein L3J54_07635, partial [Draconibacterium sp.]|nr:hypothetical protein [Draconibacterium sp.]
SFIQDSGIAQANQSRAKGSFQIAGGAVSLGVSGFGLKKGLNQEKSIKKQNDGLENIQDIKSASANQQASVEATANGSTGTNATAKLPNNTGSVKIEKGDTTTKPEVPHKPLPKTPKDIVNKLTTNRDLRDNPVAKDSLEMSSVASLPKTQATQRDQFLKTQETKFSNEKGLLETASQRNSMMIQSIASGASSTLTGLGDIVSAEYSEKQAYADMMRTHYKGMGDLLETIKQSENEALSGQMNSLQKVIESEKAVSSSGILRG